MKHPDLIPTYARLLSQEALSEVIEDASQHLVQRAVDTGVLQPVEAPEPCPEPMIMGLLEIAAEAADPELRFLVERLEGLLLDGFPSRWRSI